jgi:hypothetical protein
VVGDETVTRIQEEDAEVFPGIVGDQLARHGGYGVRLAQRGR